MPHSTKAPNSALDVARQLASGVGLGVGDEAGGVLLLDPDPRLESAALRKGWPVLRPRR